MRELTSDSAQLGELTSEDDLRSRLEAVSDVLRALSRSAMRLQPILDQIVEAAARLGRADSCLVWLVDNGLLRHAALEDRVEATLVGELPVKGFARPVQAFELLRVH